MEVVHAEALVFVPRCAVTYAATWEDPAYMCCPLARVYVCVCCMCLPRDADLCVQMIENIKAQAAQQQQADTA